MPIDWDDFRLFAAVARAGTFTHAARQLKVSEPTVSRRIRRLEEKVGRKLFNHTGGKSYLTAEGQRILNHAVAAEHELVQAARTKDTDDEEPSLCRISAVDGISAYWLPQFIAAFLKRYPNFDIALIATQDRYSQKKSICDLSLQYSQPASEHLVCHRLASVHFTPFATRGYVQTHGMPKDVTELTHHRIVDLTLDMDARGMLATVARHYGRTAMFTNSIATMGETIRYGGGIGLLPTYAILLEREVVPILLEINLEVPLFLSFERGSAQHPAVRAMIDFLKTHVFNPKSMPWFASSFEQPNQRWRHIYATALAAACR
jgi:molybdate transport repressor ModE-like protein